MVGEETEGQLQGLKSGSFDLTAVNHLISRQQILVTYRTVGNFVEVAHPPVVVAVVPDHV